MDIYSKGEYPSDMLSNFAPHEFIMDGVRCAGMEGFLQSLKYKSVKKQEMVCALSGKAAKEAGRRKFLWKLTHNVYWRGEKIKRTSPEFSELIDRAYASLAKNKDFADALLASGDEELAHSIGGKDPLKTILTEDEFISRLVKLRASLKNSLV